MARKTKADRLAAAVDRLVRERDEDTLRRVAVEHAKDAERWRKRAQRDRETCDQLRFALDVVRERDELRAAKGGAT